MHSYVRKNANLTRVGLAFFFYKIENDLKKIIHFLGKNVPTFFAIDKFCYLCAVQSSFGMLFRDLYVI